jgi:hypothetical protein
MSSYRRKHLLALQVSRAIGSDARNFFSDILLWECGVAHGDWRRVIAGMESFR